MKSHVPSLASATRLPTADILTGRFVRHQAYKLPPRPLLPPAQEIALTVELPLLSKLLHRIKSDHQSSHAAHPSSSSPPPPPHIHPKRPHPSRTSHRPDSPRPQPASSHSRPLFPQSPSTASPSMESPKTNAHHRAACRCSGHRCITIPIAEWQKEGLELHNRRAGNMDAG